MSSDFKRDHKCNACGSQKLKKLENNPAVRKLQDKIEHLSLRLAECKNENQMLKRDLQLAKKMVYQEIGDSEIDFKSLINCGTEQGWKGRQESVLVLKAKVQELKGYLREIEGDPPSPQETSSEMFVKQKMPNDKKKLWRMELERRLARESAEKDINPLVQECFELRKNLDIEKKRFKEVSSEIKLLRAELNGQVAKNEEDVGIVNSFKTLENQLQETLTERAEIQQDLEGSLTRNKRLTGEVETLQEELKMLQKKTDDSNILIDSLTNTLRNFQETIDAEKQIVQQNVDKYKEEMGILFKNHGEDAEILDQLQSIISDKSDLIDNLKKDVVENFISKQQGKSNAKLSESNESNKKPSANSKEFQINDELKKNCNEAKAEKLGKQHSKESLLNDQDKKKGNISKSSEDDKLPFKESKAKRFSFPNAEKNGEIQNISDEKNLKLDADKLQLECAKFKVLCQAVEMENERLPILIENQNKKMSEVAVLVVEAGGLIKQKNEEKQVLLEKINRLQKSLSTKRKKGKLSVAPKSKLEEMRIKCETQKDENEFLRHFLRSTVCNKAKDLKLITGFIADTKQFFQTSLNSVKESLVPDIDDKSSFSSIETVN